MGRDKWVVITYEQIDVELFGSHEKKWIPADPHAADVVIADSADDAIRRAATRPGFYAAMRVPDDIRPSRYALVERGEKA